MQKYRADVAKIQTDGAIVWWANSMRGTTLARIDKCRLENLAGDMRSTVYAIAEPDTWFSVPAATRIMGCRVNGYIIWDADGNRVFRQTYY